MVSFQSVPHETPQGAVPLGSELISVSHVFESGRFRHVDAVGPYAQLGIRFREDFQVRQAEYTGTHSPLLDPDIRSTLFFPGLSVWIWTISMMSRLCFTVDRLSKYPDSLISVNDSGI